jgi:hypothetical protein
LRHDKPVITDLTVEQGFQHGFEINGRERAVFIRKGKRNRRIVGVQPEDAEMRNGNNTQQIRKQEITLFKVAV